MPNLLEINIEHMHPVDLSRMFKRKSEESVSLIDISMMSQQSKKSPYDNVISVTFEEAITTTMRIHMSYYISIRVIFFLILQAPGGKMDGLIWQDCFLDNRVMAASVTLKHYLKQAHLHIKTVFCSP